MPQSPDRLILVFDADSGLRALLVDVLKKAVGRGDCTLCDLTYGPLGKRRSWSECTKRLGLPIDELHRDEVPAGWRLGRDRLPCILARTGEEVPFVLVDRDALAACGGRVDALERRLLAALAPLRDGALSA